VSSDTYSYGVNILELLVQKASAALLLPRYQNDCALPDEKLAELTDGVICVLSAPGAGLWYFLSYPGGKSQFLCCQHISRHNSLGTGPIEPPQIKSII